MAYDKKKDYQAEIDRAVAANDYKTAAQMEQSRNEKIAGEGLGYETTNKYAGWLGDTDYGTQMQTAMSGGAPVGEVMNLYNQRMSKASSTEGMQGYTNDSIMQAALAYIANGNNNLAAQVGTFKYEDAPEYSNKYKSQIDDLTRQILGSSYEEWAKGGDYAALQKNYTQAGQRAMQDTLGQVAARTGGLASSYAGAAGQQTYNNYMTQLEEAAREMYAADLSRQRMDLDMLMALEQGDYGKYRDLLGQHNADKNFAYGMYQDAWTQRYRLGRDNVEDMDRADNKAYGREQDALNRLDFEDERDYSRALEKAENLAKYGDFSGYRDLGYSEDEISRMQMMFLTGGLGGGGKSGGSGRSGGRSSSRSRSGGSSGKGQDYDGLFAAARASENPQNFISSNYKKYGFSSVSGLWSQYQNEYSYSSEKVSKVAQGLYTDINKYYGTSQDRLNKIQQEYQGGGISKDDYMWLLDRFGLL